MYFRKEGFNIKIADIIGDLLVNKAPIITEDASIALVLDEIIYQDSNRVVYVVNENNQLQGTITLNEVARHIFSLSHEHKIHSRRIMDMVTSEDVEHIMKKRPPYVRENENLGDVIGKMIKSDMKHLAIVDENKKIICDISMVDIIKRLVAQDKKQIKE